MAKGNISSFFIDEGRRFKNLHRLLFTACACFSVAIAFAPQVAYADESGISFWLPGLFGSLAAVPGQPGLSFSATNYYESLSAGAEVARARQIQIGRLNPTLQLNLQATLRGYADVGFVTEQYVFATPVLGGQAAIAMGEIVGHTSASVFGTLTASLGPFSSSTSESIGNSTTGFGDLYPLASLKWNQGVHNYMIYGSGDIPVGSYESTRLTNIGIGHGAADIGGGYTYLDQTMGQEFSAVAGFTYNLINPSTNYQSGVDFHLDWATSQYLSKQVFVGIVGYVYQEVGCDSGSGDRVGCFRSRVLGTGPQIGYLFPVGDLQGYFNLRAYGEFAAEHRPEGVNVWMTFALSPAAPTPQTK
jgi:hypothetical protein